MKQVIEKGDIIIDSSKGYSLIVLDTQEYSYDYIYLKAIGMTLFMKNSIRRYDPKQLEHGEKLIKSTKLLRILYGIN